MSGYILCQTKKARSPYFIQNISTNIYTLEELCYYMYNNIYSVTEEFFDQKLALWLKEQVGYETLAKKMKVLIERKNDLKDLVVTLLCACDYYKEDEVVKLVEIMDEIANLPLHEKNKIIADNYLRAGKYGKSLQEYKKLLYGNMAERFSTEEYGDLLHNQAIALFHVSSFQEAATGFREAYARNHNEKSLNQYLYTLLMNEQKELFVKEGTSLGKSLDELEKLERNYEAEKEKCSSNPEDYDFIENCKKDLRASFAGG